MLQPIFKTLDEIYYWDVFDCLDDAATLGIISDDESARLNCHKGLGMAWLNPKPEQKINQYLKETTGIERYTEYMCDHCKQWFKKELKTNGYDHYCELCSGLKEAGLL